ncbi:MAG: hypothetical protein MI924_10740 [Chloroflexales bacterium]|nr:hypothetical protein [Chloroflexales bacterium]
MPARYDVYLLCLAVALLALLLISACSALNVQPYPAPTAVVRLDLRAFGGESIEAVEGGAGGTKPGAPTMEQVQGRVRCDLAAADG